MLCHIVFSLVLAAVRGTYRSRIELVCLKSRRVALKLHHSRTAWNAEECFLSILACYCMSETDEVSFDWTCVVTVAVFSSAASSTALL